MGNSLSEKHTVIPVSIEMANAMISALDKDSKEAVSMTMESYNDLADCYNKRGEKTEELLKQVENLKTDLSAAATAFNEGAKFSADMIVKLEAENTALREQLSKLTSAASTFVRRMYGGADSKGELGNLINESHKFLATTGCKVTTEDSK